MFETTAILLHKLGHLLVGIFVIVILLVLGIKVIAGNNSSDMTGASGSPNVVATNMGTLASDLDSDMNTAGYNLGQTGHTIRSIPKPFITATTQHARLAASNTVDSFRFVGDTLLGSVSFVGRGTIGSLTFMADMATLGMFTKPAYTTPVPVIHPMEALADVQFASSVKPPQAAPSQPVSPGVVTTPPLSTHVINNVESQSDAESGDLYAWGNCTWWVSIRRSQTNDPIPNSWGNATYWAEAARQDGYVVDHSPSPGAIMQISGVDHGLGHVAFVESVDPDGTWNISEMNVLGLDVVDHKAEPASAAANYYFIHDRG